MKRNLVTPLAIALLLVLGLEATVWAASPHPQDSQVVYNGKCPGDKDDDCKD
ncbi:hypothetical protein [Synechocystis sp. LKSZ1]|uniref:hypothetical protein n=1 Tax=Synechocystis sp. LKSZ1 TaxID=3144951 RepID=UPI00336BC6C3